MKTLPTPLADHLATGATTLSWCWKITRDDGTVFGFTDHDRALSFDGVSYEPETGLIPAELRAGTDLSVDAQDAEGVLTSDRITETDILDGLWDNAAVEVWRVNWQDAGQRVLLRRGAMGQVRRGRTIFVAEVRSMAHALNQTLGRTYQSSCDAELGDARCKVDLESATYKASGGVSDLLPGRTFSTTGLSSYDTGWFAGGIITWATGANAGRLAEVMRHDVGGGLVTLTLQYEPVRAVAPGDTFVVRAGCDKSRGTCRDRFANIANFRGFPDIPGQSTIYRYARKAGNNDGGVL